MQKLRDLLSQPPASFAWSDSEDGQRTIGTSEGFVLDIWADRIEAVALFPPDRPDLVTRNATLMQLLLMAVRPDWASAPAWLAQQMRAAARSDKAEETNYSRRVAWQWDKAHSRATLKVAR